MVTYYCTVLVSVSTLYESDELTATQNLRQVQQRQRSRAIGGGGEESTNYFRTTKKDKRSCSALDIAWLAMACSNRTTGICWVVAE